MLNGEYGEAVAKAMKVIVKVGESLGAEELVEIKHAHASGISYYTIGDAGLRFIEDLYRLGGRVRVFSTINPVGLDLSLKYELGLSREFVEKQMRIVECLLKMGFRVSMTCTPYLIRKPGVNEHLAWGESSAVGMANSYYGAMTNREGGPIALAAALTGRIYKWGMHLEEYRIPTHLVLIDNDVSLNENLNSGLIGYIIGENIGNGIPYIKVACKPSFEAVKYLTAAAGASGSIPLVYIENVTPNHKYASIDNVVDKIRIGKKDLLRMLKDRSFSKPDLVFIGCPHATLNELIEISIKLRKYGRVCTEAFISTSRIVYDEALKLRIIDELERIGVKVLRDTCPVVCPAFKKYKFIATNSLKAFFYLKRMYGLEVEVYSENELVDILCRESLK